MNLATRLLLPFAVWSALTAPSSASDPAPSPAFDASQDVSEYLGKGKAKGMLGRNFVNSLGPTEAFLESPPGHDERREAIIDALWQDDEEAFLRLAAVPGSAGGGLVNQTFAELSRELKRYRKEGFRTMRHVPINPNKNAAAPSGMWCRHQWMTLPENLAKTPKRGLINLIFDPEDLSLRFVRITTFDGRNGSNLLPQPNTAVANDVVRERPPVTAEP